MNLIHMANGSGTADSALTFLRKFLDDASSFSELFESGVRDENQFLNTIPEKIAAPTASCAELKKQATDLLSNLAERMEQSRVILENANRNLETAVSMESAVRQKISDLQSKQENCIRERASIQEAAREIQNQMNATQREQAELARRANDMQYHIRNESRNLSNAESLEYRSSCRERLSRMRQDAAAVEQKSLEIALSLDAASSAAAKIDRAGEAVDAQMESIAGTLAELEKIHEESVQNLECQKVFFVKQTSDMDALRSLQEKVKSIAAKLDDMQRICVETQEQFLSRKNMFLQQADELGNAVRNDQEEKLEQIRSALILVSNIREAAFRYEHIE